MRKDNDLLKTAHAAILHESRQQQDADRALRRRQQRNAATAKHLAKRGVL